MSLQFNLQHHNQASKQIVQLLAVLVVEVEQAENDQAAERLVATPTFDRDDWLLRGRKERDEY